MLIYVTYISERLIYTLDFIFKEQNVKYTLTNDLPYFLRSSETKLNYSSYPDEKLLTITPCPLLFEEDIRVQKIQKSTFEGAECLAFDGISDPFASIFYLLTRYEEYLEFTPDEHDRFRAIASIQYKMGWLHQLICDRLVKEIIQFLYINRCVEKPFTPQETQIIPTFDIDNTYAYQHKETWRKYMSISKDLLQRNKHRLTERRNVLSGVSRDPYDTFSYITSIAQRGYKVKIFWHLGDYGKYDKNIRHYEPAHRKLIQEMDTVTTIGIHPSYASNENFFTLKTEKDRLEEILNRKVSIGRQHFLKLRFPETYIQYIKAGILEDYTLGFAQKSGFRTGTLRTHAWFNVKRNETTDLQLHPFAYMDGTLLEYEHLSIEAAKKEIKIMYDEAVLFGGNFIFLWHNETINDYKKWKGWTEVLEYTLSLKTKNHE